MIDICLIPNPSGAEASFQIAVHVLVVYLFAVAAILRLYANATSSDCNQMRTHILKDKTDNVAYSMYFGMSGSAQ